MSIKGRLLMPIASYIASRVTRDAASALKHQDKIMRMLLKKAAKTSFGLDHGFSSIASYHDFKAKIPIRDYEKLRPYFDRITQGEQNVLWPGKPKYLAKTSGTTSGVKYIPISKQSIPNHIHSARNALFSYVVEKNMHKLFDGKMIFLSGSPELDLKGGIPTGRLSGIVNHEIPAWLRSNQLPSWSTNCIEDWEEKLEKVIEETIDQDLRVIGGIPPWVQMYYERILKRSGKKSIIEVFPNLTLFIYGGVNFDPYRAALDQLVGKKIDCIEYFPASEGFFAYSQKQNDEGLLLNANSGIFYEFIALDEIGKAEPNRISLHDVKLGVDYALIVNNNAGLFGYDIGDVVRFVSLHPYKLVVSGRVKHYISAFGEHVIGKEVEEAMTKVSAIHHTKVTEFTVAPQVNPIEGLPYHEWFVEFDGPVQNMEAFAQDLDAEMCRQNIYYEDLIVGKILKPLVIRPCAKDTFIQYMKSQGRLGGQNKVPRLTNDRKLVDAILEA